MRRRSLMEMVMEGDEGMTISALPSIIVKNNRSSGTINVNRIHYSATTIFKPVRATLTAGSTATYSDMATDGTHFWIDCSACSTVSYDGETCAFVRDGTSFMVTVPDNFDATIPFVFS